MSNRNCIACRGKGSHAAGRCEVCDGTGRVGPEYQWRRASGWSTAHAFAFQAMGLASGFSARSVCGKVERNFTTPSGHGVPRCGRCEKSLLVDARRAS